MGGDHLMINNTPFVNDQNVVGKWEYCDIIRLEEDFDVNDQKHKNGDKGFKEIYFLPNGQKYWVFEGWTKGFLFTHEGGDAPIIPHKYNIKEISGDMYLFLEMNDGSINEQPYVNVLKKVSNKEYDLSEIGVHDKIDLPFVIDKNVIGTWNSITFVPAIDHFDPDGPKSSFLWLKSVCFHEDGTAVRIYGNETWNDFWTSGVLIDKSKVTASAYVIKIIENKEFLFLEWKMGNYVYGRLKPEYYVFERSANNT